MRNYLRAKDENRPLYMSHAFTADAVLKMTLRAQAIAFPPEARGRDAITEALVRTFGQTYENVFTFYLSHPGQEAPLAIPSAIASGKATIATVRPAIASARKVAAE